MKYSVVLLLLATLGSGCQALLDLNRLYEEFYDVSNMIAVQDLLAAKMTGEDPDLMRIVNYMNSSDFFHIYEHMWKDHGYRRLYDWLRVNRLRVDALFDWIFSILHWGEFRRLHPIPDQMGHNMRVQRSLNTLVEEVQALIPYESVLSWTLEKMALDHDMLDFLYKLQVYIVYLPIEKSVN